MLSDEQNRRLTQVGAGTPMGELLRRYWMPIAAVAELDDKATKPMRLLGEDLVLYRDQAGTYGLLDRHCAHRRADLSYGWVEGCGLRCNYHGWVWDHTGKCLEQPFEEVTNPEAHFKDRVRIKAYPVEAKAGLLWAYLGPPPIPLVPTWEPFTWRNGFVQIVFSEVPCNWFQCQENSIDPVHFEWLHGNWTRVLQGDKGPKPPTHLKIGFEEFEYGFVYRRVLEGQSESDELWTVGRTCLWPNCLFTGGHFEWRVPIDDENMLSVGWFFDRVPNEMEPFTQDRIPYWYSPIRGAHGALDHHARDEPGLRRLGGPGRSLRSDPRALGRKRPWRHYDAQADARAGRACGPRRRAQGGDPRSGGERLRAAPDHRPRVLRRRLLPNGRRQAARAYAGLAPA